MRDLHAFSASQNSASTHALMNGLVQNLPRGGRVADLPFLFLCQRDHAIPADRWYMYMKSFDRCVDLSLFVWRAG